MSSGELADLDDLAPNGMIGEHYEKSNLLVTFALVLRLFVILFLLHCYLFIPFLNLVFCKKVVLKFYFCFQVQEVVVLAHVIIPLCCSRPKDLLQYIPIAQKMFQA